MGECKFCHKDAGFLRKEHEQCRQQYENDCAQIRRIIEACFASKIDFYTKAQEVNAIMSRGMIQGQDKDNLYTQLLDNAVESYLNDGIISDQEYRMVARFIQFSGVPQSTINANHALDKVVQAQVLGEIVNGKIPAQRFSVSGGFPFMLEKNETPIWLFRNITLHEQKTIRQTVGRHSGFNIRVAKGIYYRTGGFKGTPVETTSMQKVGVGVVCLTTKQIYFSSPEKSFKIPYNKIIAINSYSNGIDIQKDGNNAKPIFLEGVDSWFCYNVIANLK